VVTRSPEIISFVDLGPTALACGPSWATWLGIAI
jgi:hypothetical protein